MGNADDTSQQVCSLVEKHAGKKDAGVTLDSRLVEDLRILGDDAEELMEEFAKGFGVDLHAFDFNAYFPDEASADMHYCVSSIARAEGRNRFYRAFAGVERAFWGLWARNKNLKSLVVADLVSAAKSGKWEETSRASRTSQV